MITLLIYLVVAILVLSFAVWVIRSFCPPEFQKYAYLLVGLVVLIFVCYTLLGMGNGAGMSVPRVLR
jgi:Na+-driven multidrug efflux pump